MTPAAGPKNSLPPEPQLTQGLRLRLWIACLGGSLVTTAGVWLVIGAPSRTIGAELPTLVSWLAAVAGLGIVVGAAFALWLDRGIVVHLRGLVSGVMTGQVTRLRGLPSVTGWGEISQLTQQIQSLLTQQRHATRAAEELGLLRAQIGNLQDALRRWVETERWTEGRPESGALGPLSDWLNRGFHRLDEVREQNQEAARQVAVELARVFDDAREAAEQAERGFVEATALLTTIRELDRLASELAQGLEARSADPVGTAAVLEGYRSQARAAIEELMAGSSKSVDHLGRGLVVVQEVSEQVQRVAQFATTVALSALHGGGAGSEASEELRQLMLEVRTATDKTASFARQIESDVAAASEEMRAVRRRVAEKLEAMPVAPTGSPPQEAQRLLERVREMIQDANQKGERIASVGERVSRSSERILKELEEEGSELEGLAVRLGPPALQPPGSTPSGSDPPPARPAGLKLLGAEHLMPEEGRSEGGERP